MICFNLYRLASEGRLNVMFKQLLDLGDPGADLLAACVLGAVVKAVGLTVVGRSKSREFVQVGTVSELYLYPVKSCGAYSVREALATPVGLYSGGVPDRNWMILAEGQGKLNMRLEPKLTTVTSSVKGDNLVLRAPGMAELLLPLKPDLTKGRNSLKTSVVTGDRPQSHMEEPEVSIIECGGEAEAWISGFLGRRARIVFSCAEMGTRNIHEMRRDWDNNVRPTDQTVFSYLTSYLMTSTASLRHLNDQLEAPVTSVNFRPNIVINNTEPYDEDTWKEMRIGNDSLFHSVEPCLRCFITTIDPATGNKNKDLQPLKKLRSYRCREPYGDSPVFGNYMSLDVAGRVAVGDPVYALK